MTKPQIALIVLLELALLVLTVLFWGSIASIMFVFLLIMVPCALLRKRFLVDREGSDFDDYN